MCSQLGEKEKTLYFARNTVNKILSYRRTNKISPLHSWKISGHHDMRTEILKNLIQPVQLHLASQP